MAVQTQPNKLAIVRFAPKTPESSFHDDLKKRIEAYFERNNLSKHGNGKMYLKTVAMVLMYLVPFALIVSGLVAGHWMLFLSAWALMGVGMVGIGCSVMHDSNHGSYSENKTANKYLGALINLVGGYSVTWRIQHNILHHTYTNIEGLDGDIDAGVLLRFSPHSKRYKLHRFQHLYAWVLYGMLTLQWATIKDFVAIINYKKIDLLKKEKKTFRGALVEVTLLKLMYFSIFLVLPILFSGASWGLVLAGFLFMQFIAGLALSCIFQLAHVMEGSEFPAPKEGNKMENSWAIHQVLNTINFSPRSHIMSWFIGGLNYQIEHHLFPHICHVHYPQLSHIVRRTAAKWGIPYQVQPTFVSALAEHGRMLRKLGAKD